MPGSASDARRPNTGRRRFLRRAAALCALCGGSERVLAQAPRKTVAPSTPSVATLFLAGDIMTGRGIDQILPHPGASRLHERYLNSALSYVDLAQRASGPIPRPAGFSYIWGDGLDALRLGAPDARIVNLETAITVSDAPWPGKGIHYRMHPANVGCLVAAHIDCCALANNHVLDWGYMGLAETLGALRAAGISSAGAGADLAQARAPATIELGERGRVLVFAMGMQSSGVPPDWVAAPHRAGVDLLPDLSEQTLAGVAERIAAVRRPGDLVVASIHWGSNWGYDIPHEHQRFARGLVEHARVDVVHGHSSHHPRALEVFRERLILYGCGDLINDYEGIEGHADYRGDLGLMYFAALDSRSGRLMRLSMAPMQMRRFRLTRPAASDTQWLARTLDREAERFGARVHTGADGWLKLDWADQEQP